MNAREPILSVLDEIIAFGRLAAKDHPESQPVLDKLRRCEAARIKVVDLIEAARYLRFALRDGPVLPRDYAAKRLEEASLRAEGEADGLQPRFTVFCTEAGGATTTWIESVEAPDANEAAIRGRSACAEAWACAEDEVCVMGVMEGEAHMVAWTDESCLVAGNEL